MSRWTRTNDLSDTCSISCILVVNWPIGPAKPRQQRQHECRWSAAALKFTINAWAPPSWVPRRSSEVATADRSAPMRGWCCSIVLLEGSNSRDGCFFVSCSSGSELDSQASSAASALTAAPPATPRPSTCRSPPPRARGSSSRREHLPRKPCRADPSPCPSDPRTPETVVHTGSWAPWLP